MGHKKEGKETRSFFNLPLPDSSRILSCLCDSLFRAQEEMVQGHGGWDSVLWPNSEKRSGIGEITCGPDLRLCVAFSACFPHAIP